MHMSHLEPLRPASAHLVAEHFARLVHRKLVSVDAFVRLADELRAHGSPEALVRGCLEAATDELLHTRMMTELAERFGVCPDEPRSEPARPRTLLDLAIANATGGCVRETYAALEASFQAEHADDDEVRAVMATVARDETVHAALAWDLHAWLEDHLPASDWAEVEEAMASTIDELSGELARPRGASLTSLAGLPDEDTALALLDGLRAQLWTSEPLAA